MRRIFLVGRKWLNIRNVYSGTILRNITKKNMSAIIYIIHYTSLFCQILKNGGAPTCWYYVVSQNLPQICTAHLQKYTANLYRYCWYSTDLRYILGHSVVCGFIGGSNYCTTWSSPLLTTKLIIKHAKNVCPYKLQWIHDYNNRDTCRWTGRRVEDDAVEELSRKKLNSVFVWNLYFLADLKSRQNYNAIMTWNKGI